MRIRLIAVFLVGMVFGAVLLGGSVFTLQRWGDDAQAKGGETWQLHHIEEDASGLVVEDVEEWVTSLPASCDLVPSAQVEVYFYRCPPS